MNEWNAMSDGDLFFLVKVEEEQGEVKVKQLRSVKLHRMAEKGDENPLAFVKGTKSLAENNARILLVELSGEKYKEDLGTGKALL